METNEWRPGAGQGGSNEQGVSKIYDEARTVNPMTTNRKLRLKDVVTALEEAGLDPMVEICAIVQSGELDAAMRVKTLLSLAEFVHPKKKSVEGGDPSKPLTVQVVTGVPHPDGV